MLTALTVFSSLVAPPVAVAAGGPTTVRAYVNDRCIVADEPFVAPSLADRGDQQARLAPLAGIVVGKLAEALIKYAIGGASARLKKAGERSDTLYAYTRQANLYRADLQPRPAVRLNGDIGCMTVVAAQKFLPDGSDCTAAYQPKEMSAEQLRSPELEWKPLRADRSVENILRRANVCVDGKVDAIYEARFDFSADGTAYRLRSAGYRVNALQSGATKSAQRTVFYTLEIVQPGPSADAARQVLSTAWVQIGTVSGGAESDGSDVGETNWLKVPALSAEARRAYEERARLHLEVAAEIESSERALTRTRKVVEILEGRIAGSPTAMATALRRERDAELIRIEVLKAELDARRDEYASLPQDSLQLMPVTIQVGVTESRSEKAAYLALADVINSHSDELAVAASTRLASRDVAAPVPQTAIEAGTNVASARVAYYDALLERKLSTATGPNEQLEERVADAKLRYNLARRSAGLEAIP
jgi:hypothetical protein